MNALSLRELKAQVPAHAALLDLFQECREHVVAVAATHLLPDTIAVTTRGGFIELINTQTGAFRLFVSYLNHIPLDATLRCFSLVPGLVAASSRDLRDAQQYLAYSLAYSNELLLAQVETGQVSTLASFTTRPSAVYCDGDYIACGEGCGQVSIWRISTENRQPHLLWRLALFEDAVVTLRVHREVLAVCAADGGCVVCNVDTGALVTRLVQEADQAVCVLPLTKPLVHRTVMAVCSPRRFSVYQSTEDAHMHGFTQTQAVTAASWLYQSGIRLDAEVQCASSFGGYLAAGTASGVVLLFACDALRGSIEELVRFDVGFAVVAVQLYSSDRLLVVTSAGDVWCWPLADLLPSAQDAEVGTAEAEHPPEADAHVPQPSAPPQLPQPTQSSAARADPVVCESPANTAESHDDKSTHDDNADDDPRPMAMDTTDPKTMPALANTVSRAALLSVQSPKTHTGEGEGEDADAGESGAADDDQSDGDDVRQHTGETTGVIATAANMEGDRTIVMEVSMDDDHDGHDAARVHSRTSSNASSLLYRGAAADETQVMMTSTVDEPYEGGGGDDEEAHGALVVVVPETGTAPGASDSNPNAALVAFKNKLGPVRTIEGLRRGPRMDPRKVVSVLQTAAVRSEEDASSSATGHEPGRPSRASVPEALQSTQMLSDYRDGLLSQHVSEVDMEAYIAAHRLEAEALLYRYPVRQPRYTLGDRAFESIASRPNTAIESAEAPQSVLATLDANALPLSMGSAQRKALADVKDDLVDETYGRVQYKPDPALAAERQRGGPALASHFCDDLLAVSSICAPSSVLFAVPLDQTRRPSALNLALPLPATPSAF